MKLRFERFRINLKQHRRLLDRSFEIDAKKFWIVKNKKEIASSIFRQKQFFRMAIIRINENREFDL